MSLSIGCNAALFAPAFGANTKRLAGRVACYTAYYVHVRLLLRDSSTLDRMCTNVHLFVNMLQLAPLVLAC